MLNDVLRVGLCVKCCADDVSVCCQGHYSITKGAALLGLGVDNIVKVKTDSMGRMIPAALDAALNEVKAEVRTLPYRHEFPLDPSGILSLTVSLSPSLFPLFSLTLFVRLSLPTPVSLFLSLSFRCLSLLFCPAVVRSLSPPPPPLRCTTKCQRT